MFAVGRKAVAQGVDADAVVSTDDWLSAGKSFPGGKGAADKAKTKRNVAESSESALQVYKHRHGKHRHKDKKRHKEKKRRSDESKAVASRESRHLAKKSKEKKRRRSWSRSDSSKDGDEGHRSSQHSQRRRRHSRSNSRSRTQRDETRIVKQSAKDVVAPDQEAGEGEAKLFEFDCVGDRENQFFGSTYVHDQPLYELATRRSLLTGAWVFQTRPKYTSSEMSGKEKDKQYSGRYFSLQARKMERNGRQKRLYLAYSEKRLSRSEAHHQADHSNESDQSANEVVSHPPEMAFIPLDPVLDADELVNGDTDEVRDYKSDVTNGTLLTDGQSVEQHLVQRSKMLNAAVAANPHGIDTWLDLMAFQEQTLRLHTKTKRLSSAMKASVVEKQAAILARALANNPQSRELHRVKLNMSLQSQASGNSADVDSFQRHLESLLSEDLTNSELWFKLLQSHHQHFGSFSVQSVRNLYARILAVFRGECASAAAMTTTASPPHPDSSEELPTQAEKLSVVLLDFHLLMCLFEKKAGFIERSIAQLQALIDFSLNEGAKIAQSSNHETHLEMLRTFALRWNDEVALGFGEERGGKTATSTGTLEENAPKRSVAEFLDYIQTACVTSVYQVNPPEVLRTKDHKQSLLSASAAYQRQSRVHGGTQAADSKKGNNKSDLNSANDAASDDSETESGRSGKLTYSNLHGYRINIDDADDSKEYERILSELRGTENARAHQSQLLEKEKMKHAVLAVTKSQVEDQRAKYDSMDGDDRYLHWLMREEVQTQLQWAPLRLNNPLHQDLIEKQPDRATLTEEIQPFLFSVPVVYQWRLIAEILQICGVEWRGEYSWESNLPVYASMYADSSADYELLVAPILSALNPQADNSSNHTLFLDPCGRKILLENALLGDIAVKPDVLRDPSKVAFARRVFAQALDIYQNSDEKFGSTLKCLWISFEAEVTRSIGASEENLAYARRVSQKFAQNTTDGDIDFSVLYAYAKLELRLGNERQVRRICENTLKSFGSPFPNNVLLARNFHRFVFLRARLEMWSFSGDQKKNREQGKRRILRCLYTLWAAWKPEQLDDKEKETLEEIGKKHKKRASDYLQERLMSDPSTGPDLIARYRAELGLAIQHCAKSTPRNSEQCKPSDRSRYRPNCWSGYCLHNLALVVYAYDGFDAACHEYRHALASVEHQTCSHVAWMWTCFFEFMQQHEVSNFSPTLAPRVWRSSIGEAVKKFPNNELFLRLFVDSETGNTISQVLRTYFLRVEKRWRRHFDSPELVEWLFALLCELCRVERSATIKKLSQNVQSSTNKPSRSTCCLFHRWGMNATAVTRIRQMFENMVNQVRTKGNALCWGLYIRFEVALGKVDAAKKVLYRGIAASAWSKGLYLDGLRVMRPYLSEEDCQELLEFMEAKDLNLRIDFE
ncbi:Protein nrde2 [Phytophthora pseudosyringae]|uniref:Protein nrde2 n=1 Tax=Phytophthora pseudosyringae TaxID=221518 RepID=A0A8T1W5R1_9STRA|nr:Protein nrde2 [Phytophthora pseudosyringae]